MNANRNPSPLPHPLIVWLDQHEESVVDFAERIKISFTTVYSHIRGNRFPSLDSMQAIEDGTNKEVTVQMQSDWRRKKAKPA